MIVYEVAATVREDVRDDFERFMIDRHIPDLIATGCFFGAAFEHAEPGIYRTRYESNSRDDLEQYLYTHAARLREQILESFPDGIQFERAVWETLASF